MCVRRGGRRGVDLWGSKRRQCCDRKWPRGHGPPPRLFWDKSSHLIGRLFITWSCVCWEGERRKMACFEQGVRDFLVLWRWLISGRAQMCLRQSVLWRNFLEKMIPMCHIWTKCFKWSILPQKPIGAKNISFFIIFDIRKLQLFIDSKYSVHVEIIM